MNQHPHYYRLEGESLHALNKLIEYDRLLTDFRMTDIREQLATVLGKKGPEKDPAVLQSTFSLHFTSAQVRGYKEKLGFNSPPIAIRDYGEGTLYRAYHVFPKIAMNPGTSKVNFGIGDLFKDDSIPAEERLAIYTSFEDYKGNHFVPPGAVKLTTEQFAAYDAIQDKFEYYRTYDEGTALPDDFNPQQHQTISYLKNHDALKSSHRFLIQGETQTALLDYDKKRSDWTDPYQDFRRFLQDSIFPTLGVGHTCYVWIEDESINGKERLIDLFMSKANHEINKDLLEKAFTIRETRVQDQDEHHLLVVPRLETALGKMVADELAKVPPYPTRPHLLGFDYDPEEKAVQFTRDMTGFPYMKIEGYEDGETQLLVFRMPPHIKTIEPPQDCKTLPLADYQALAGSERDLSAEPPATHVFRFEGESLAKLKDYARDMADYAAKETALYEKIKALLHPHCPTRHADKIELCDYKTGDGSRDLDITLPQDMYDPTRAALEEAFIVDRAAHNAGRHRDRCFLRLTPRTDTEIGRDFAATQAQVPYPPSFPDDLYHRLGFGLNSGYTLMKVESLDGLQQKVLLHNFPAHITGVEAPANCLRLTAEEFVQILADSWDVKGGSPPPPRPAHLMHLPQPEGYASFANAQAMKQSKDADGLPLHERTEFSWFKVRRGM